MAIFLLPSPGVLQQPLLLPPLLLVPPPRWSLSLVLLELVTSPNLVRT